MKKNPDLILIFLTAILVIVGILMVFSASSATSAMLDDCNNDPYFYLKKQFIYAILGAVFFFLAYKVDLQKLGKFSFVGLLGCLVLLILVLIPGIGIATMGARRWLGYGFFTFQPAEFAKIFCILYLADYLSRRGEKIRDLVKFISIVIIIFVVIGLIEAEPDLGTAVSIFITMLAMLFVSGARWQPLATMITASATLVIFKLFTGHSYRMERMKAFINPWKDSQGSGYHVCQSLIAVGSGGLTGLGLGQSRQKFFYLPEQYTDFIFAVLGEELGLIGTLCIVVAFIMFMYRGFKIASQTSNLFMRLLAVGCTFMITFQAFMNMGVVVGIVPCTGIPLPFISFGGSSLIACMIMSGLLLNVSKHCSKRNNNWQWGDEVEEIET